MEKLLEQSKLTVCQSTKLHVVNQTTVGVKDRQVTIVPPSQSLENRTSINYSIPPSLQYELELNSCSLDFSAKILKDGKSYTKSDQISSVQALGVFAFANMQVFIGK